jgi:hypothetical protein
VPLRLAALRLLGTSRRSLTLAGEDPAFCPRLLAPCTSKH